jgi:hypothetical protein
MRLLVIALLAATAATARAQDPVPAPAPPPAPMAAPQDNSISPGMSEADVRARWGEPLAVRRANEWTYMFYASGVEHIHRFNDVVLLQNGQVVDAIIRAPGRSYNGQSSSPAGRMPANTPPPSRPTP